MGERHSEHSLLIADDDGGFMDVEVLVGNAVYIWQGDAQITVTREHADKIALAMLANRLTPHSTGGR